LSGENFREEGFSIFKNGSLRRLSPTHYVVKSQEGDGWHSIELKDGKWICDWKANVATCPHVTQPGSIDTRQRKVENNRTKPISNADIAAQ
jgi:hypothetical protein